MGLLDIAKAAAKIGFAVAGDVKKTVTIKTGPTPTHNTTTDATTVVWAHTNQLQAVVYDAAQSNPLFGSQKATEGQAPTRDKKVVLIQADDPALTAPPTEDSRVTIDSLEYEVEEVEIDPAGATYSLTVER